MGKFNDIVYKIKFFNIFFCKSPCFLFSSTETLDNCIKIGIQVLRLYRFLETEILNVPNVENDNTNERERKAESQSVRQHIKPATNWDL